MGKLYKQLVEIHSKSADFVHVALSNQEPHYSVCYYETMVNSQVLVQDILPSILQSKGASIDEIYAGLPFGDKQIATDIDTLSKLPMVGCVVLSIPSKEACIAIQAMRTDSRSIEAPEVEFSVIGPKDALVESLDTNILLVRRRLPVPQLRVTEIEIGTLSKTRCAVLHLEGIANPSNLQRMMKRLSSVDIDVITDSTSLIQMIVDNKYSLFPQFIETERPDRLVHVLCFGGIAVLVDGSSQSFTGPATIGQFLVAYEDYYLPWHLGSFFRILRILAILFSIFATPVYIAMLTYHYHIIPTLLMGPIISSRINLPFPPYMEVILMELTIELLREAGARLPSKIGQTIGIVGGIVIGTAAVLAALTSNILLTIVALSALASFTVPIFHFSNTIRVIRYPFILAAQMLGFVGVVVCASFFLAHLLRLKSLGTPYLQPFYPIRFADWEDAVYRVPSSYYSKRPGAFRPLRKSKKAKSALPDIDE
ncbi:spore germination protein [Paenibacillus spongiae]|uniref:Spore germination protein n=1 Tax=Paenibacillus spongiae TaxID=2909671 RepID=A0ABY5S4G7_9BACL|nr:spore germination protein [Paenibacillus spongiae]UVI28777.1 spore germination protein [Paenibacillus spongiae]